MNDCDMRALPGSSSGQHRTHTKEVPRCHLPCSRMIRARLIVVATARRGSPAQELARSGAEVKRAGGKWLSAQVLGQERLDHSGKNLGVTIDVRLGGLDAHQRDIAEERGENHPAIDRVEA